jgi:hypothetical protein
VRFAFPLTEPELAEIVVVPAPVLVANPLLPAVLLIVATLAAEEPQCAELVTSWVEPSVNRAAAVNCWVVPQVIEAFAGVTAMETIAAALTVNTVDPLTPPALAVIVAVPVATEAASPLALAVVMVVSLEVQLAVLVRSCLLLSVNVPVAVNCWTVPSAIVGLAGVRAIDTSAAAPTLSVVEPEIEAKVAETLAVPVATPLASPCVPAALLIVAMAPLDELHCTELVMSCWLPSV